MSKLNNHLIMKNKGNGNENNIILGDGYRITLLTNRLLRVEVNKYNKFTDYITQAVICRDFGKIDFATKKTGKILEIETNKVTFYFNEGSKKVDKVKLNSTIVPVNNKGNLKGTVRTLDAKNGKVPLNDGILSINGVTKFDDSKSLIINEDGEIRKRKYQEIDYYIFAYGKNYREEIAVFYKLCGKVPLIPRYALGNWWSRYKAYTQDEYINLMKRFEKEKLPITVATVDMDWHWVNVNKKFGTKFRSKNPFLPEGWTGYSWNTDLFYDYKAFLRWLKEHNYHTTLNLHPASGVRFYEDQYKEMADRLGVDKNSKQTIPFDLSNNEFINAYFEILHHPYEKEGVDFWWLDWQQGKKSDVEGLDPLWALNHYHFLDNNRDNKRGMILSRYSGAGAHRYPLGFSGDTFTTWKTLKFQPYFTANASNIGYGWWSHDIGGHYFGIHDDELYLRWCQFGVFSPINRLHSTNQELMGKEPWKYCEEVRQNVNKFLRLRHRLIPYLYTMNYLSHTKGRNLCEPMYYEYPNTSECYKTPNQYLFGTELIVAPVVSKRNRKINMAKTKVWVPEGRYTDIFTGRIYQGGKGGKFINMFRDYDSIPVLAKAGGIIPLSNNKGNDTSNPKDMTLLVYRGTNKFTLYEDDGISFDYEKGKFAKTTFEIEENDNNVKFVINKIDGDKSVIPETRKYRIKFVDIVKANGKIIRDGKEEKINIIEEKEVIIETSHDEKIDIILENVEVKKNPDEKEAALEILTRFQAKNIWKILLYYKIWKAKAIDKEDFFVAVKKSWFPKIVKQALEEVFD